MEFNFLDKIISGFYSNWFFDVFMVNIAVKMKNTALTGSILQLETKVL